MMTEQQNAEIIYNQLVEKATRDGYLGFDEETENGRAGKTRMVNVVDLFLSINPEPSPINPIRIPCFLPFDYSKVKERYPIFYSIPAGDDIENDANALPIEVLAALQYIGIQQPQPAQCTIALCDLRGTKIILSKVDYSLINDRKSLVVKPFVTVDIDGQCFTDALGLGNIGNDIVERNAVRILKHRLLTEGNETVVIGNRPFKYTCTIDDKFSTAIAETLSNKLQGCNLSDSTCLVYVGGRCRIPKVQQLLEGRFGGRSFVASASSVDINLDLSSVTFKVHSHDDTSFRDNKGWCIKINHNNPSSTAIEETEEDSRRFSFCDKKKNVVVEQDSADIIEVAKGSFKLGKIHLLERKLSQKTNLDIDNIQADGTGVKILSKPNLLSIKQEIKNDIIYFSLSLNPKAIKTCDSGYLKLNYTISAQDGDRNVGYAYGMIGVYISGPPIIDTDEQIQYIRGEKVTFIQFLNRNTTNGSPTLFVRPTNVYLEKDGCPYHIVSLRCQDIEKVDNGVRVPLVVDFSQLQNPSDDSDRYTLVVNYDYGTTDSCPHNVIEEKTLTVNKDDTLTELRVDLNGHIISNGDTYSYPDELDVFSQDPIWTHEFKLTIRNNATRHNAAPIFVSDFSIENPTINATPKNGNNNIPVNTFVTQPNPPIPSELNRNNLVEVYTNIVSGKVTSFEINGIVTRLAELSQKISLKYWINNIEQVFQCTIVLKLARPLSPNWLCIDFGTSAVVALYGTYLNNIALNPELLERKTRILSANFTGDYTTTTDSPFINSDILLNNGTKSEGFNEDEDYRSGTVMFSPGDQFDYSKLLPSLKSMMGHTFIPTNGAGPFNNEEEHRTRVEDVYKATYHQLFELYLSQAPTLRDKQVEKTVMTFPNTFSNENVQMLRIIAQACFPTLEQIKTVCESDAIVYKYLNHRETYLKKIYPRFNDRALRLLGLDNNVMVYDMGGGTLDVTIFSRSKQKVSILGKYGNNKAGNYLDYILARIVAELSKQNVGGISLEQYLFGQEGDMAFRYGFKQYVKKVLKIAMSNYKNANDTSLRDKMLPEWAGHNEFRLDEIGLKDVFGHPLFQSYLKEISEEVVDCCLANIGRNTRINMIIFSGRMTAMNSIRNAVTEALKRALHKKDIDSIDISSGGNGTDSLKSSVVEGALEYAESTWYRDGHNYDNLGYTITHKPFYCNYCIVIKRPIGEMSVHCFLDNTKVNYSVSERVDLNNAHVYLLQTYARGDQAILNDFDKKNVTTELAHISNRNGIHTLTLKVDVDADDRGGQGNSPVRLTIDNAYIEMHPQEDLSSETFKKSSWPLLF